MNAPYRSEFRTTWLRPLMLAGVIIVLDQLTKALVLQRFGPDPIEGTSIPVYSTWVKLTYIENTGVAFGMFERYPQIFTVTSILITLGALYYYRYHLPNQRPMIQLCLGLIVGGAIGNIIDRLRFGYVVDFIHITWFPGIFNIADSCITVGTILLAVVMLLSGDKPQQDSALASQPDQPNG